MTFFDILPISSNVHGIYLLAGNIQWRARKLKDSLRAGIALRPLFQGQTRYAVYHYDNEELCVKAPRGRGDWY